MRTILACLVLPSVVACTSQPTSPFHEHLDRETGVTVSRMNQAMMFYDPSTSAPPADDARGDQPGRHFGWRDFLYLGPLEINRTGERTYYIWASLVRRERSEEPEAPSSIVIRAGEGIIEVRTLTEDRTRLGTGEPTYPAPAPWAGELYFSVSPGQLQQMATPSRLTAQVQMPSGREFFFEPMRDDQSALRDFVRFVVQGEAW